MRIELEVKGNQEIRNNTREKKRERLLSGKGSPQPNTNIAFVFSG